MRICSILVCSFGIIFGGLANAASKKPSLISWYEPEVLEAHGEGANILLSGETAPRVEVSVDLSKIISISGGAAKRAQKSDIRTALSDERGEFQIKILVPFGILQIPIQIKAGSEAPQNLLVIFEVASNAVKINAKTIKKSKVKTAKDAPLSREGIEEVKPKAERAKAKAEASEASFDVSIGVAYPTHKYSQKITSESDVSFESGNAPSLFLIGGGKIYSFGYDIGYNNSSGSLAAGASPFVIKKGDYKWQNMFLTGSYLFGEKRKRNSSGYELKVGYGVRHQPFLSIDPVTKDVYAVSISMADTIFGFTAKFGQLADWLFEGGINYHLPGSSSSSVGEFVLKSGSAIDVDLVVKKAVGENYLLSGFVKLISNQSSFEYQETPASSVLTGTNTLLVYDVGGSVGFSF